METEYVFRPASRYTIVFVHGIIGSPVRFCDFYPLIPESFSYVKVVLDGHGKKARDFSRTSLKKWEDQILSLLRLLKEKGQKVIYVGHSLGCLFGLCDSLLPEDLISSLFLLNVPLRPKLSFMTVRECLKCTFTKPENYDEMTRILKDNCCIELSKNPFVYLGWIPRFLDLFKKVRETRKIVPLVKTECICFHSGKDELVRKKALDDLRRNPSFEIHVQKDAGHYYLPEADLKEAKERFVSLLSSLS